jgi:uncharacterized protein with GYD domain
VCRVRNFKEKAMPKFLVNVVYTSDGAKGLRTDGGTKREHVIRMALESLGGTLEAFYFTMGETDAIVIADVPDAIAAAAVSLNVSASGAARCVTVPLLSPAEMDHVAERKTAYKGPGVA